MKSERKEKANVLNGIMKIFMKTIGIKHFKNYNEPINKKEESK